MRAQDRRFRLLLSALSLPIALFGCEPPKAAVTPERAPLVPGTSALPAQASKTPAPGDSAPKAASMYSGHGLSSVPPEVLARYAPPPLPTEVSSRIQAMLDLRAPGAGQISSDGKTLYFTWTITGVRQIFRLDGPQRFPVQLTGGEDATVLAGLSPDDKYLIVERDRKGEENPGLYLQDVKGGPLVTVQHKPQVQTTFQFVTDDARFIYFRANDVKPSSYVIYRYDVEKKQRETVFDQEGIWAAIDIAKDGRLLLAKEVGSNMVEFYEFNPKTKALSSLFGQNEREDYEAAYGAREGEVIVQTPKFSEYRRLYVWKAGKFTPISPAIPFDVASFRIDRQKQRILYQVNEGGSLKLHGIDAKTFKDIALPAFPKADHVHGVSTSGNGLYSTFGVDPGDSLPVSYSADWRTRKLVQWHLPSIPEIDTSRFVRPTLETYPARDGTKIPMFVYRPTSCGKPCPVVVSFHGGPEAQSLAGFNTQAQLFVQAGFVYIEPNVRGSDGYGKTWLHADDGPNRLKVITDIEDCARFIRSTWSEGGKAPKIGITGGSYGGYSTLVGMTMFAGAYDAGAEIVGMSNLVTFLQNTAPYRRPLRISEYGDPEKDREALLELSPIKHLEKVKGPLLLIQGATDPRVPVGEALQIHKALEERKLPSELMVFANEGHGAQRRDNKALMLGHVLRFFQEHLKDKKG